MEAVRHSASGAAGASSRRLDDAAFGEFLGYIYGAATRPDDWITFFNEVRQWFGGHAAIYERSADDPGSHQITASNLDPDFCRLYNQHYNATNVWATSPLNQASAIVRCDQIIGPRDLERTEFYGDWLRPQDLKFAMTCKMKASGRRSVNLGLVREARLGTYEEHERHFLARLLPHLNRAAEISSRIEGAEITARSGLTALETLGLAAVLVNREGRIRFANSRADAMFSDGSSLASKGGCLVAQSAVFPHFATAVRKATDSRAPIGTILSSTSGEESGHMSLAITPLEPGSASSFASERLALVVVSRPSDRAGPSCEAMRSRYGFTEAQATLAAALCAGTTLSEHARERGVSQPTVKSHLAALFAKTGASRQADLIRILLNDPLLAGAGPTPRRPH